MVVVSLTAEQAPRFCILGGGLAALSSAYFLQRAFPLARICVVDASSSRSGQICTARSPSGRVLEQGFHSSILVDRSGREALGLVRLLGLEKDVVSANIEASARRHLFHHGRVQLFPRTGHMLRFGPALMSEPLWGRCKNEDETVHSFVSRRTSTAVADRLADPICRGHLGGDARQLSVRACWPRLWFNEQHFRSVFVGSMLSVLPAFKRRSWLSLDLSDALLQSVCTGGRCYSFQNGLGTLVARLQERLTTPAAGRPVEILSATVAACRTVHQAAGVEVVLEDGRIVEADTVISALQPQVLADLLARSGLDVPCSSVVSREADASICSTLRGVTHTDVGVVSVSFHNDVLRGRFRGAGYYCGSLEAQGILGMTWDSQLFPHSVRARPHLTVYVGQTGDLERIALDAIREHLAVKDEPTEVNSAVCQAVPQYIVGHHRRMRLFDASRVRHLPWLQVVGGGYYGPRSPADDVVDARLVTDAVRRRFVRFPTLIENEVEEDVAQRYGGGFDVS